MTRSANSSRTRCCLAGVKYYQAFKAGTIEALVACQQSVSLKESVGADQEVCRHPRPGAAALPVSSPGNACFESGLRLDRAELDLQICKCGTAGRNRRKAPGDLRPHHIAGEQPALRGGRTQRVPGSSPELGVVVQEIKQNVGIDGGYHFIGYSPRSSFMISSVRRPSFKMPKYLSNGSRGARLVITNRPRCSSTSRTWPVRIPNRTRKGFGMVTCPFSETVIFILLWYRFLQILSNRGL